MLQDSSAISLKTLSLCSNNSSTILIKLALLLSGLRRTEFCIAWIYILYKGKHVSFMNNNQLRIMMKKLFKSIFVLILFRLFHPSQLLFVSMVHWMWTWLSSKRISYRTPVSTSPWPRTPLSSPRRRPTTSNLLLPRSPTPASSRPIRWSSVILAMGNTWHAACYTGINIYHFLWNHTKLFLFLHLIRILLKSFQDRNKYFSILRF